MTLEIKNLNVQVEGINVLKNINLFFDHNKTYALLGPNGNGKSTLFKTIMGHPDYKIISGDILFNNKSIIEIPPNERAQLGIFMSFQYPVEVPGVITVDFLHAIAKNQNMSIGAFYRMLNKETLNLNINMDLKKRFLNDGFSGGEKKKNEILQMNFLKPSLALLDEIDSGLDVDALNIIAKSIKKRQEQKLTTVIISHYEKIFKKVKFDEAYVILNGEIVKKGGKDLVKMISKYGYGWVDDQHKDEIKQKTIIKLGCCDKPNCESCPLYE